MTGEARVYLAQVLRSHENRAFQDHSREVYYRHFWLNIEPFVSNDSFLLSSRAEQRHVQRQHDSCVCSACIYRVTR